ncbi:MAG: two-component sensor histidine kinase [Alphaproteobacteria bacterium HGW-Alphaproteobacteria-6]|nr:MAG: two-component sensor histidine kinase [Alphaproteobacteria bacterium HGW-Alphaproteobacteria-6]
MDNLADDPAVSLGALRAILGALPMAVILVDAQERVILANAAARVLLGEGIEGRVLSAVLRHPAFVAAIEETLAEGRASDVRVTLPDKGGETHLAVRSAAIPAPAAGQAGGAAGGRAALVSFEDMTALEQSVSMRRDFVANVSHELRTPLTALVGFIETLRGAARDDPAARERFLGIMEREAGRMIRLVSDLLSLSRVEAEERRRPADRVEVAALLRSVMASHRDPAAAAGVALTLDAPDGPVTLRADADQLVQVFHNLIENALKYGASGGAVTICLTRIEREPVLRGPAVEIAVTDRGEGIDPLHLPRLTERFYRVDTHRSREKGGTGLGLAIVKHIVNRHRGRLRIDSEIGKGSTFRVILPAG